MESDTSARLGSGSLAHAAGPGRRRGRTHRDRLVAVLTALVARSRVGTDILHWEHGRATGVAISIDAPRVPVLAAHRAAGGSASGALVSPIAQGRVAETVLGDGRPARVLPPESRPLDGPLARPLARRSGTRGADRGTTRDLSGRSIPAPVGNLTMIPLLPVLNIPGDWSRLLFVEIAAMLLAIVALVTLTTALSRARNRAAHDAIARSAMTRSEERFRSLIQHSSDIICVYDRAGVIRYLSPSFERILGRPTADLVGTASDTICHPDDRRAAARAFARALAVPGTAQQVELRFQHADGTWRWFEVIGEARADADVIDAVVVNARDVTERKALDEGRAASERRYRTLVERMPALTYISLEDPAEPGGYAYEFVSPQLTTMLGYQPEEWEELDYVDQVIHPDDRQRFLKACQEALGQSSTFECEYRMRTRTGEVIWVYDYSSRLETDGEGRERWQGVILDVSEEKRARLALEAATERFRTLVEQTPAVVYELTLDPRDPTGRRFTYVSPAIQQLYGVTPDQLMADPELRHQLVHPDDRAMVQERMAAALLDHGPVSLDFRGVTVSGDIRWVNDQRRFLFRNPDGTEIWQGLITDVTAAHQATESLREAELRYRTLVEEVPVVTYRLAIHVANREDRHYQYLSPQFKHLTGYSVRAWMDDITLWEQNVHPDDYDRIITGHIEESNVRGSFDITYRMRTAAGTWFWCREVGRRVGIDAYGYTLWQGVWLDVTAQKEAELASHDREEEFRLLFSSNPQPTWVYDRGTHEFLEVNTAACALYGYDHDTFLTMRVEQLVAAGGAGSARHEIIPGEHGATELRHVQHVTREGRSIDVDITSYPLVFRSRSARLVIAQDVTARHALEARLVHQAYHDTLTGLPNRALFSDRLKVALRQGQPVAVLFVDLDDFKLINDTLGHELGDALLIAVGERLLSALRSTDTIARLGGDEFTVLLEDADLQSAVDVADRLIAELSSPFRLEGHDIVVSPSIGIAQDSGTAQPEELLRRADVAMYVAKQTGKQRYAVFDSRMDILAWQRLELEAELRRGIAEDQLTLVYQPIVDLRSGETQELEALVRWRHPERGLLPPSEFIGIAEQSGLILELDRWVLRAAARQMATWIATGAIPKGLAVAVNLSARQFQGRTLVDAVTTALADTGLEPRRLMLEITETVALSDIPTTLVMLRELKKLGVSLAIDDFGSGYSGLSYLQRCPIDAVKIDRSYVDGIGVHPGDTAMIRAVMAFAKTLGLQVTAEGVETEVQLAELRTLAVDAAQGFLFARPLPPEEVVAFIQERSPETVLMATG